MLVITKKAMAMTTPMTMIMTFVVMEDSDDDNNGHFELFQSIFDVW